MERPRYIKRGFLWFMIEVRTPFNGLFVQIVVRTLRTPQAAPLLYYCHPLKSYLLT